MKRINNAISLVMAVVMLITGTPALQASELALDRAQMAELQKEILQNVKLDFNSTKDPVQELMDRYEQAKINNEARIKELSEINEVEVEAAKEYLEKLKEDVKKAAKTEAYAKIPRKERKIVALSTNLFDRIRDVEREVLETDDTLEIVAYEIMTVSVISIVVGGLLWGLGTLFGHLIDDAGLIITGKVGKVICAVGYGTFVALTFLLLVRELCTISYKPVISSTMSVNDTIKVFSEKPFMFLDQFENVYEYANLYDKCPELLKDAVDIEFYVSSNPNLRNMKDKLFTQTIYWYQKKPQERVAELHKLAERLRAEAKAGAKEQFNNLKVGLEEA